MCTMSMDKVVKLSCLISHQKYTFVKLLLDFLALFVLSFQQLISLPCVITVSSQISEELALLSDLVVLN